MDVKDGQLKLTHIMRRHHNPAAVAQMIERADANTVIGGLPPELCPLVEPGRRAFVTYEFAKLLSDFLWKDGLKLYDAPGNLVFPLEQVSDLFGIQCFAYVRVGGIGRNIWRGGFGVVAQVKFPKIRVSYALKSFDPTLWGTANNHGGNYEISTAFAANKAEPRDNCPIYLASLEKYNEFMLSKWAGDKADGVIRPNKNEIFATSLSERHKSNYRLGRRIDFGETGLTEYGAASYRVRKLYRKIIWAVVSGKISDIQEMYRCAKSVPDMDDLNRAINIASDLFFAAGDYSPHLWAGYSMCR